MNESLHSISEILDKAPLYSEKLPIQNKINILKTIHSILVLFKNSKNKYTIDPKVDLSISIKRILSLMQDTLNKQLDLIIHHAKFKKLESKWLGLIYLLKNSELGDKCQVKVLNVTAKRLLTNLTRSEWDSSTLFKLIYEEELGTFGGIPYSAFVFDYYFTGAQFDFDFMRSLSDIFAAAHAPCISSISPFFFGDIDDIRRLAKIKDITRLLKQQYNWHSFRNIEQSRYMALACLRVLGRSLYTADDPRLDIPYTETVDPNNHEQLTWINPAYPLALAILNSHSRYGWTTKIRGVQGGGLIDNLPIFQYVDKGGEKVIKCPVEIQITDRQEKELSDLGLIPLCHCKHTSVAVFFGSQSSQKPTIYINPDASENSELSTSLQYMLIAGQFIRILIIMLREKIGSYTNAAQLTRELNEWISQYVTLSPNVPMAIKYKKPLLEAKVIVFQEPGAIGKYRVRLYLVPHLHLNDITLNVSLVSKIPIST